MIEDARVIETTVRELKLNIKLIITLDLWS